MGFKADLHTHTTHSDGWLSVESLLRRAILQQVDVLSITDHDTVSGFIEAEKVNTKYGLKLVPGIELSAQYNEFEVHVLGYYFDTNNKQITEYTETLKIDRLQRCNRIVDKLKAEGVDISLDEVKAECKGEIIGRPHIAKALIKKKIAKNFSHAFRSFLGNNAASYEKKYFISPTDAVKMIHDAGGIAVLAHPGNFDDNTLSIILQENFDAIEAIHPSHSTPQQQKLINICKEKGIPYSGGSDFHGGNATDRGYIGLYFLNKKEFSDIESLKKM
ncbi:MAG: PHP domain-containing protein [Ignavibacteriales bacterium]|mgnify:FL=1|jgi:predicted metal-dependent phosphoesterase TrpH|nr:PHP domain-containing protein [Ignavibacteriales bacterium]